MTDELSSKWRAACIAVENAVGIEDADADLAAFAEEARSGHVSRSEVVALLTAALARGDPWEALAYTFHVLRWPELRSALEQRRSAMTSRRENIWGHLHDAFDATWEDRDLFPSLSPKVA